MKAKTASRKYVRLGTMLDLMAERDGHGRPVEFDMTYCKLSTGELVRYEGCVLTSRHSRGNTLNIRARYRVQNGERLPEPFQPKKFRIILITKFNSATVI